jgi:hypothetical protein
MCSIITQNFEEKDTNNRKYLKNRLLPHTILPPNSVVSHNILSLITVCIACMPVQEFSTTM